MLLLSHTVIAVYLFQAYCMAQTSISPDICIVAVSLSNCDKSYSKFAECSTITDQNELVACVCTQELFSAYVRSALPVLLLSREEYSLHD